MSDPRWHVDPGYSSNDATHPRNRPAGWSPSGLELSEAEAVGLARAVAAALAPARPATRVPGGRRSGRVALELPASLPAPPRQGVRPGGRSVSQVEKGRWLAEWQRRRDERLAELGDHPGIQAALEQVPPGRVCSWW